MATYTPNLNLGKPEATDPFGNFRQLFNDNMDILDNGGGGGSGGHTIVNENGTDMPAEGKLQFTGNVSVTDDNVNGKTVVDILGGGGNVYGAFIDPSRSLTSSIAFSNGTPINYTATEDCIVEIYNDSANALEYCVDSLAVYFLASGSYTLPLPLKKGQTLTSVSANSYSGAYHAYGLTQGTNGIFTPIIYSDTERVIGVWRDNKPLYQKTVSIGSLPNNATKTIAHGISDIDTICSINGIAYDGSGKTLPLGYVNVDSYTYDVQVEVGKVNVEIKTKIDFSSYTGYITLRYTKTTDSAGSGTWNTDGVPTVHYSTSEQVIGTWENGKPLYARLINPNVSTPYTVSGDIKYGSFALSNFIADIDMAWIDTGMSYMDISGATKGFISAWYEKDSGNITVSTLFERTNVPATLAIRYTKTTD